MSEQRRYGGSLHIGPAGWSYPDWEGVVYPPGLRSDRLLFLTSFFNCVELNSSFYRVPNPRTVESWAHRLAPVPCFRVCIKVLGRFTHERDGGPDEYSRFIHTFDPLFERGIAGPFLLQFPWSFRFDARSQDLIKRLAGSFGGHETAVEVRHGSWDDPDARDLLSSCGFALCNLDQPVIGDSLAPAARATVSALGYIRLHGRNYRDWFRPGAGRDARYDYCYTPEEIKEWADRARRLLGSVSRLFVITNNHFRGQALVNAFQLRSILEERRIPVPASLLEQYPRQLADYAEDKGMDERRLL
jgi:uncharacterized protein YecE (DUF72 family)